MARNRVSADRDRQQAVAQAGRRACSAPWGRLARARWNSSVTSQHQDQQGERDPRGERQVAHHTIDEMAVEGDVAWDAQTHGRIPSYGNRSAERQGAWMLGFAAAWRTADEPAAEPEQAGRASSAARSGATRSSATSPRAGWPSCSSPSRRRWAGSRSRSCSSCCSRRYAENPRVVTMFLDEARLAAKLNHPSIVHLYDVADEGGHEVHRDGVHPRRDGRRTSSSAGSR